MSTSFTLAGQLNYPPDSGQPAADRAFSITGSFDAKSVVELVLTGSGTHVVNFGSIISPGAAAILIKHDAASGGSPVQLRFNGSTDDIEVASGGFIAYSSPVPAAGITALSIVHTANARVRIWILG